MLKRMKPVILIAGTLLANSMYSQCCNIVTSENVPLTLTEGICVNTADGWAEACMNTDKDKDGIVDKLDKCPDTPAGVKVTAEGCEVDTDADGIVDSKDKCPTIAGLAKFEGCADTDGDGIQDSEDACPSVAGLAAFKGCADTDGDGIQDSEDACPTVAGKAEFGGCADSDGDGIADNKDECPSVAGTINGCPDKDGDGVADKNDKCPEVAGLATLKGCPEIKKDVLKKAAVSAQGIFFETGSNVIQKKSYKNLDALALIMKTDPALIAEVQGHTDNVGDAAKNKALSQKRADAVKTYLVSKGVDAARLTAVGYGQEQPVADNKTKEGKAKNRRVEFKLDY